MKNFFTLADLLLFQASNLKNEAALNFKEEGELKSFSNQQFLNQAFYFACGLKELGLQKGQTVANISYQNPIWLIVDLGAILAGAITVPIFHDISKENLFFELSDSNVSYIFSDNEKICEAVLVQNPAIKIITYHDEKNPEVTSKITFKELIAMGQNAANEGKYDFETLAKELRIEISPLVYKLVVSHSNPLGNVGNSSVSNSVIDDKEKLVESILAFGNLSTKFGKEHVYGLF